MNICAPRSLSLITALAVLVYVVVPQPAAAAEPHVVSLSELRHDLSISQQKRAKDLEDIERVLSLPAAEDALAKARLSTARVTAAIAELSDEELSRLASRARAVEQDVEGGIIVGLLALIGLIVVVVVVLSVLKDNK